MHFSTDMTLARTGCPKISRWTDWFFFFFKLFSAMCGDAGQLFGVQKSILILFLVSLGAKSVRYKQLVGTIRKWRGSTEIRWIIYYHPFLVFKFRRIIKPQISKTNILKNCFFFSESVDSLGVTMYQQDILHMFQMSSLQKCPFC